MPRDALDIYKEMLGGGFSPQEQNLFWHGYGGMHGGGRAVSPRGDISTVLQAVVSGPGSRYYSIPTVWDGQALTIDEARDRAAKAPGGWGYWPSYATPEAADLAYDRMHQYMDRDTALYRALMGMP